MLKKIFSALFAVIMLSSLSGCAAESEAESLKITFLKIGKADSFILQTASGAVLIDAGEKDDGEEILNKLGSLGIEKLDYFIVTHYDKDHIGGAKKIIKNIAIGKIIEPGYAKESEAYSDYSAAADKAGIEREVPEKNITFTLGGVNYSVFVPEKDYYENENNYSLAVKAEFSGHSAFFAGDALSERISELVKEDISADLLKIPHHGSLEDNSAELIDAVSPDYAVITCSDKNPPDDELLSLLSERGIKTLKTSDGDFSVIFTADGIEIKR